MAESTALKFGASPRPKPEPLANGLWVEFWLEQPNRFLVTSCSIREVHEPEHGYRNPEKALHVKAITADEIEATAPRFAVKEMLIPCRWITSISSGPAFGVISEREGDFLWISADSRPPRADRMSDAEIEAAIDRHRGASA